jgi:formate dehydrogenase major subunit
MTNTWQDIGTADVIMVIGGNPAENHPMGFKHIRRSMLNYHGNTGVDVSDQDPPQNGPGGRLIVVDPRFTRSAAKASYFNDKRMYSRMRSGTDIPFVNGMIWYAMLNQRYNQKYVLSYSNAGFLINEGFTKPGDANTGKFSGFVAGAFTGTPLGDVGSYNKATWGYCTYNSSAGSTLEYKAVNIATDFWDGSGTGGGGGGTLNYLSGTSSTNYNSDNLSLWPADATYIGKLRQDLFDDGVLGVGEGFNTSQRTAWEHMIEHYSRYDAATCCDITGADPNVYDDICDLYTRSGAAGKAGTIMYAMGTTQHTVGTQNIRAYSTLQILLGNMGLSGGGVNAQRGESNVQGSTDHCLLFHILPGYITQPKGVAGDALFDSTPKTKGHPNDPPSYCKRGTPFTNHLNELNWWGYWGSPPARPRQSNFRRYIASLMKTYWWDALGDGGSTMPATAAQMQQVYDWIPKLSGNHSHIELFEQMHAGTIQGLLCFGQNPAVGGPNALKEREALRKLNFLVVSELWETETAAVWKHNPNGSTTGDPHSTCPTEVFLLPAACHLEKDGSVTNSSRWAQFRYKAVEPPGNNQVGTDGIPLGAKHEIWMLNAMYEEIKAACTTSPRDDPIQALTMGNAWYNGRCGEPIVDNYADPSADYLDKEINGQKASDNTSPNLCNQVANFTFLLDDGTTSSGNWLYCQMYDSSGNKSKKRDNTPAIPTGSGAPIYSSWAWDWPLNRRIIYNGGSLVPHGNGGVTSTPWDSDHPVLTRSGTSWIGDVSDAVAAPGNPRCPFIMKPEGHCRVHGMGRADGPYPEHYEPVDTLFYGLGNPMGHPQVINPAITVYEPGKIGHPGNGYSIVATTYRCTEHWQAGAQTRHLPWQAELWPDVVVEMSPFLAAPKGIKTGDAVRIESRRESMYAYALVTNRFETYTITDVDIHHIGIFWHWGYKGIATGDSANVLTPHVGDANTRIPEFKAFLCKVDKAHDGVNQ